MKKYMHIKILILLFSAAVFFTSCEKKYVDEYDPYRPVPVTVENANLHYNSPVVASVSDKLIESEPPTFTVDGPHYFGIDSVYTDNGKFKPENFDVDPETGVVFYNNKKHDITVGEYTFDISLVNTNGIAIFEKALVIKVEE